MSVLREELTLHQEVKIIAGPHAGCFGKIVGIFAEDSGLSSDLRIHLTDHKGKNPNSPARYVKHAYFKLNQIAVKEKIKMIGWQSTVDGKYCLFEPNEEPSANVKRRKHLDMEIEVWK